MPRVTFRRPLHKQVAAQLALLDSAFLASCQCHFGGGTRIVLELGEYRESKDIDLLCSDQAGYRKLRESLPGDGLGPIARKRLRALRDVRADQYGVRTMIGTVEAPLKFEIVREARIALTATTVRGIPVSCLDRPSAFAEKFLANADRGIDTSTLSRDAIDLAFMLEGWAAADASSGFEIASAAYGAEIQRKIAAVCKLLLGDRRYLTRCIDALSIEDTATLRRGLRALERLGPAFSMR